MFQAWHGPKTAVQRCPHRRRWRRCWRWQAPASGRTWKWWELCGIENCQQISVIVHGMSTASERHRDVLSTPNQNLEGVLKSVELSWIVHLCYVRWFFDRCWHHKTHSCRRQGWATNMEVEQVQPTTIHRGIWWCFTCVCTLRWVCLKVGYLRNWMVHHD